VVFGAGASLANAQHFHRERRVDRNPPLDTTFFEKIRALGITVSNDLRSYAGGLPTGSPFEQTVKAVRMEEFFKDLFFDFSGSSHTGTKIAGAYTALIDIYRRVISETTDWMGDDSRKGGPVGKLIAHAVELDDAVTLMTFNQDLVLENEIHKRARLRPMWCLEHGYGAFSDHVEMLFTEAKPTFEPHDDQCDHGKRLRILKLHGSLNWQVRMNGRQPSPRILSGEGNPPPVQVTRRRRVPSQLRFTKPSKGRGRTLWYMWPVIVPPVYNKQGLINQFFPQVWGDAQAALLACSRLIFFGYSLPPADIEAEKLFQRAIFGNSALAGVDVINPDPDAAARYARLVPGKSLRWFPDVGALVNADTT
jgi:hypothetical protein